jgi:hypothetical protein
MRHNGPAIWAVSLPFTLSHPLRYQVTTTDAEEGAIRFSRNRLCKIGFSGTWRPVEQDALPRLPLASKQVRELDGKNDRFFQGFLRAL